MENIIIGSDNAEAAQGIFKFEFLEQENHSNYCMLPVKIIGSGDSRLYRISITVNVYLDGKYQTRKTEQVSVVGNAQTTLFIRVNKKDFAENYILTCYEIKTDYV